MSGIPKRLRGMCDEVLCKSTFTFTFLQEALITYLFNQYTSLYCIVAVAYHMLNLPFY